MAYSDQENSIQDGAPYFLYEFNTADTTYRFTDYPVSITGNSLIWEPFPIKHTESKQSNELSKNSMTVTIPIGGTFASLFIGWSLDEIVTFTLYRGHFGATDTRVNWKGRIAGHKLKDGVLELNCESIFTSMRRAGIRARYQRSCRHALYSPGCNLNKDDFSLAGVLVSAISGLTLTIPDASSKPDNWFTGGAIRFHDGSYRMIERHSSSTIIIDRASRVLTGGVVVTLYPGCDRTIATCKNKFNNLVNNGSFKWIPVKNPMGGSSII